MSLDYSIFRFQLSIFYQRNKKVSPEESGLSHHNQLQTLHLTLDISSLADISHLENHYLSSIQLNSFEMS